jgi:hypothetical protein
MIPAGTRHAERDTPTSGLPPLVGVSFPVQHLLPDREGTSLVRRRPPAQMGTSAPRQT